MDVAQSSTNAVMPGVAVLPASSEPSAGALTPAPLFREMFAKAALPAELPGTSSGGTFEQQQTVQSRVPSPGSMLMKGKGVVLSASMLGMSGGEAMPEQGDPDMTGLPDGQIGILLARAKVARSDGQQDADLLSGSEAEVSDEKIPRQKDADDAGLVGVMVPAPVVQNISHGFITGMPEASTQPVLSAAASSAAKSGTESVRETLLAVQDGGTARMEPRPVVVEGKAELLSKNDGVVSDLSKNGVVPLLQPEVTGLKAVPGKPEHLSSEGSVSAPVKPEAVGEIKAAVSPVVSASQNVKEAADVGLGGEKTTGKDRSNVARQENVSTMKQVRQDVNVEGKGETVLRELPSGVTVLNPAQTVTMGRPVITADAPSLAEQVSDRGRVSGPDGKAQSEKGSELSMAAAGEKIALKKEASSQDNSNLGHDSETAGGNHGLSQATVSSGSFDTVIKGHMEPVSDVSRESEVSELHENILSQVRDKLVNQDPSANVSKVTLKLNPHELGELQINVRLENQKMTVDITAQNPVVKEALLQNIDQLKDSLMRQNISMERFHVSTGEGQGQAFNQSFREGRQTAYQTPDTYSYPLSGYYQEDTQVSQAAFADSRENSLVDMRF